METYNEIENMFYERDSDNLNEVWNVEWVENTESNIIEDIESDVIISKWIISYDTKANISYIDTEWNEFNGIWTITFSDWINEITILDRNLWAKSNDITKEDSKWYYFQRWNNYWFKNTWDLRVSGSLVNTQWYARNNPYVSGVFVVNNMNRSSVDNRDLWWWWEDSKDNDYGMEANNWYMRQWPCPAWYHVPSEWEINKLFTLWYNKVKGGDKNIHEINIFRMDGAVDMMKAFLLPPSWERRYIDASLNLLWERSYLWTSTPWNIDREGSKKNAYVVEWDSNAISSQWLNDRGWWVNVRCFKDKYEDPSSVITLKYETNWWTKIQSQTLSKWSIWFLPWYTTHKTWFDLEWWYLDSKFSKKYDFSTKLNNDTTIYAKWEESKDNKKNNWNGNAKLTDEEIKDYYYYNCACPKWYSYTPEWVTYADPWCEIEICENGDNCTTYSTSVNTTCNKKLNINEIGSRVPMWRKGVENNYKRNCECPTWFDFVKKTGDMYADSCDRKYCVDSECKQINTRHIRVKDLCKN